MGSQSKYFIVNANFLKLRKAIGLTQEEFSLMLKIKRSLLGAYEEHRAEVKTEVIKKCISLGFLLDSQLYDFLFSKSYKPTPTKHYRKLLVQI